MKPFKSQQRSRRGARALLAGALMLGTLGFGAPAGADPVLCVTVTYRLLGGPEQPLHDDCHVSSGWETQEGHGPDCSTVNNGFIKLCTYAAVAHPMP